jgi:hypothetical protein
MGMGFSAYIYVSDAKERVLRLWLAIEKLGQGGQNERPRG